MNDPFVELNPNSDVPLILLGEHAGFALPNDTNRLEVSPSVFQSDFNFAGDHGTRRILFQLAHKTGATTLLGRYSRLLVDLNREVDHPQLIWSNHHNINIPYNQNITSDEKSRRLDNYYSPFHNRVSSHIKRLIELGQKPVLLTIHSYTPAVATGQTNTAILPDVGLLFYKESQILKRFENAYSESQWSCERNSPYNIQLLQTGSLIMHQKAFDLDGLALEINVGNLRTVSDQDTWAKFIGGII